MQIANIIRCFIVGERTAGRGVLALMCVIHYTVLIIVLMTYLPIVAMRPKINPGEEKASEVNVARNKAAKMTSYHLLVHILHYTPGTFHAFAGFAGYEPFWVYVLTVICLQMGAICHAILILWSKRVQRLTVERLRAAGIDVPQDLLE